MASEPWNCLMAFPNFADVGYYTPTFTGGACFDSAPLENLQSLYFANKTRFVNNFTDNTWFQVNLGTTRSVKVVAIPRHTLTRDAQVTFTFYDVNGVLVQTKTVEVYPIIYGMGSIPFTHPSFWDGKITEEDRTIFNFPVLCILDEDVICRYVKVEISDQGNTGTIDLARLFVSPGWQPSVNFAYGSKLGVIDPSIMSTSLGGARFFDKRNKARTAVFSFDYMNKNEAFAQAFDMQYRLGKSGQLLFCYDPSDTVNLNRMTWVATLSELDAIAATALEMNGMSFQLLEVVA